MSLYISIAIGIALLFIIFFAGIEVAFASANRLSIELKKKQGYGSGILLSKMIDEPSRFIGTVIIGFNLFLVAFVLLVSIFWNILLTQWITTTTWVLPVRLLAEILLSMIVVIGLGEIIPRAIFRAKADGLLFMSARSGLLGFCYDLLYPLARVFIKLSEWILNIIFDMRIDKKKAPISSGDLERSYQQSKEYHEEHSDINTALFESALSLHKVRVRECLVPRKEIEAIELNASIEEVRKKLVDTRLSKLVVYSGTIDAIVGYIHQLDLFKKPSFIKEILLKIPAVPESMSATDLITKLTRERKSIAWVVDEFGGTAGIVTMEDILEEIFGEIKDEYDVEELEEKKISDVEYIFSGRLELDYLIEKYGLVFPEKSSETLSGFIIHQHETIPRLKERIIVGDYEFEVLHVSDTRIEMVRLRILE